MKITVEIADPLFRLAKQHCSEHAISMRELVEKCDAIAFNTLRCQSK